MNKTLIPQSEIFDLIVNCYQTDPILIEKYHVLAGSNLSTCVDRTVIDLISNNANVYKLEDKKEFIGYFGQLDSMLYGFFVLPNKRVKYNSLVWDVICNHFNNEFTVGIFSKNKRAIKFLEKVGCNMEQVIFTEDGIGQIMSFKKVGI